VLVWFAGKRRGEQHSGRAVHKPAGLVQHQHHVSANTRAILIGRAGGTTPSSSWQVYRNNAQLVAAASSYDTVEQISTIFDGMNVNLRRNNGSPVQAASSAAFNGTRVALGFAGNSTFRSPPGVLHGRMVVLRVSAQRCRSRRAVCRREGVLWLAVTVIAL
jgi:hypothetical protein